MIGAVVIGRNEGARLVRCLASLQAAGARIVYVDSGSSDDSVAQARRAGAGVVMLDTSIPFTAARARNAGYAALQAGGRCDIVQFLDGDCALVPGWLEAGAGALAAQPGIGIVTGWRSEIHPEASVYNAICETEWHRPAGDLMACGGDMMVRAGVFDDVGGFNPQVIAAEDDEFCARVRSGGWRVHRLAAQMTRHDADMTRFSQWWQRAVRSGHGFAQVGALHPVYFAAERRRVAVYALLLPVAAVVLGVMWWPGAVGIAALYLLSYMRAALGLVGQGVARRSAWHQAVFLSLSKFPNLIGMAKYHWRRACGRDMRIIEYK